MTVPGIIETHSKQVPPHIGEKNQPVLFHYTTNSGFLGILTSRHMWATSLYYVNDSREYRHGLDLAKNAIEQEIDKEGVLDPAILGRILDHLEKFNKEDIYAASFTEKGDQLSQWRGYSASGGLAIAFDFQALKTIGGRSSFELLKCIYDDELKLGVIREMLHRACAEVNTAPSPFNDLEHIACRYALELHRWALIFKDKSFEEEQEWRLFSTFIPNTRPGVKVRSTTTMLIPYFVELPHKNRTGSDFCLTV